jgi:hypothetical protein
MTTESALDDAAIGGDAAGHSDADAPLTMARALTEPGAPPAALVGLLHRINAARAARQP